MIAIRDLEVRYGDFRAVQALDLDVAPGRIFGFLGPNGAGKTSTIRCLLDLVRPHTGEIRVLGRDPRTAGGALRARIGFLPGDLELFPFLTGIETLDLFAGLRGGAAGRRRETLERLGFPLAALGRRIRSYSTGMRRMIGIACAFQHEPELLVLDEPTAGLDPLVRAAFLELLRDHRRRGGTVFFSSHVVSEIEACADEVALVDGGRLVLREAMESLRARLPRRLRYRVAGGEAVERLCLDSPAQILASLPREELVDLEIRSADLADLFHALEPRKSR